MNSGDITYCPYIQGKLGVVATWDEDNTLVEYDCYYKHCKRDCEMYKKRPIGITRNEAVKTRE